MKFLITLMLLLSGCSTSPVVVPVKRTFPDLPESLKTSCVDLSLIPENTEKLSTVLATVTENYGKYHICKYKVDSWLEWYKAQKKNFESVK